MKAKHLLFCISFFFAIQMVNAQTPELWGMTQYGGTFSGGTIFSMKSDGSDFNTAYNFASPAGWMPMGNLYKASDGNLYGACFEGGDYYSCTLFRYDPSNGEYIDVYSFDITHGDFPTSGVVEKNGNLYGNSSSGGYYGGGVVYSYNIASGVYTDLFNMTSATGSYPNSVPVIIEGDTKLYGVTTFGGANMGGTIYSFDLNNNVYTDVYDFGGSTGSAPYGGLTVATDGKLYGMTYSGGANGKGVIYRFNTADNTYEDIYDFDGTNGGSSKATLMQGSNGYLYGLTTGGGANNDGVIFSFDPATATYTKLFDFYNSDGSAPLGNLMQIGAVLCGTTSTGGDNNKGTVFQFNLESSSYAKLVDFDMINGANPNCGFITLGEVATGVQAPSSAPLAVYPNPVTQYAVCSLPSLANGKVDVILTDVCGKEVLAQRLSVTNSRLTIDLGNLASGVYNLAVIAGKEKNVTKLLKN